MPPRPVPAPPTDLPVQQRRREDRVVTELALAIQTGEATELPQIAASWLQASLREDVAAGDGDVLAVRLARALAGEAPDAGDGPHALEVWRREWLRQWRRLQVADDLAAYERAVADAPTGPSIHRTLASSLARIVGARACLVLLPAQDGGDLVPLPEPGLEDLTRSLRLRPLPLPTPRLVSRGDLVPTSILYPLAPLFEQTGAAALALAPYHGGCVLLVERRHEREFEELDWRLMEMMCSRAEAELRRRDVLARLGPLALTDAATGLPSAERLRDVLRYAWAGACLGTPITLVLVRVDAPASGEPPESTLRALSEALLHAISGAGPVIRHADRTLLAVLHGDAAAGNAALERTRAALAGRASLRGAVAQHTPEMRSAGDLLAAAERAL